MRVATPSSGRCMSDGLHVFGLSPDFPAATKAFQLWKAQQASASGANLTLGTRRFGPVRQSGIDAEEKLRWRKNQEF
jgi:hypothetical protein